MDGARLDHLTKRFGDTPVVDDISLEIPDGDFTVLVGPSGCGKTTTLRMMAGLERVSEGDVWIGGERATEVPPRDRDIAMVFQSYALYPHFSVRKNLSYNLRLRRTPADQIATKVEQVAKSLDISALLDRKPGQLSGGQRQRVALGRAIIREPKLFLMDEPLSNLDANLRVQTRAEIVQLQRRLGTTTVYVTHDQTEAMTMGSTIVVMSEGRIQQVGPPAEVYSNPANAFVARFIGSPSMNLLRCTAVHEGGRVRLRGAAGGELTVPAELEQLPGESEVLVGIRPEGMRLVADGPEADLRGTVTVVEALGHETLLYLELDGFDEVAVVRLAGVPAIDCRPGSNVGLAVDWAGLRLFSAETEEAIDPRPTALAGAGGQR